MSRSLIAGANAMFRYAETERDDAPILRDPWAHLLMDRDARLSAIRYGRFVLPPLYRTVSQLQTAHCVRHRAIDELVQAELPDGTEQVVIIAAGYDMRAYRFGLKAPNVRWFEVDHADTQARKLEILSQKTVAELPPVDLVRAPIDLMKQSLSEALLAKGFDPTKRTTFVAEGIVHYLSTERFEEMFREVTKSRGPASLIFSYIDSAMYARATTTFNNLIRTVKEVPELHFSRATLEAACTRLGYRDLEIWSFEDQVRDFAPEGRGRPVNLSQHVARAQVKRAVMAMPKAA